jgi:hypothetical protein
MNTPLVTLLTAAAFISLVGCANTGGSNSPAPTAAPAATAKAAPAAAPAAQGNVRSVKGRNDWSGEIVGTPSGNSPFGKLEIGMGQREVQSVAGQPSDTKFYVTGKAWIPYFGGAGKTEVYAYYKGYGRLLFAGDGGFSGGNYFLIKIENDASERGFQ